MEYEVSSATLLWLIYLFIVVNWLLLHCPSAVWTLILLKVSFGSDVVTSFDSVVVNFYSCSPYLDIVVLNCVICWFQCRLLSLVFKCGLSVLICFFLCWLKYLGVKCVVSRSNVLLSLISRKLWILWSCSVYHGVQMIYKLIICYLYSTIALKFCLLSTSDAFFRMMLWIKDFCLFLWSQSLSLVTMFLFSCFG